MWVSQSLWAAAGANTAAPPSSTSVMCGCNSPLPTPTSSPASPQPNSMWFMQARHPSPSLQDVLVLLSLNWVKFQNVALHLEQCGGTEEQLVLGSYRWQPDPCLWWVYFYVLCWNAALWLELVKVFLLVFNEDSLVESFNVGTSFQCRWLCFMCAS